MPKTPPTARRPCSRINHAATVTLRGCLYTSNRRQSETLEFGCYLIDSRLEITIGDWLNICRDSDKTPAAMASNKSGHPRRDTRQFNLNFFVNVSSDQGSEPISPIPMDDGGKVGNAPLV